MPETTARAGDRSDRSARRARAADAPLLVALAGARSSIGRSGAPCSPGSGRGDRSGRPRRDRTGARLCARDSPDARPAPDRRARRVPGGRRGAAPEPREASRRARSRSPSTATRRMRDRFDEVGLRELLADAEVELDRIALSIASTEPRFVAEWAEWVAPLYRRRKVPMDDLIRLSEGLRHSVRTVLGPVEAPSRTVRSTRRSASSSWHRRIAGDARKRNRLLQLHLQGRIGTARDDQMGQGRPARDERRALSATTRA